MKRPMQLLADDIALGLAQELSSQRAVAERPRSKFFDLIVEEVTQEVVNALGSGDLLSRNADEGRALRLREVDNKLEAIVAKIRSATQREIIDGSSDSSEEGSKYQNIESLIKYVESSDGGGGVKLVIMNFND